MYLRLLLATAFLVSSSTACSRDTLPETRQETPPAHQIVGTSPQEAVQGFYRHLNAGDYSKAKELYSSEAARAVGGELFAAFGGFVKWADQETRQGTIEKISIGQATTRGEGGSVKFAIRYRNGTTECRTVPVLKEGASWRVGLFEREECSRVEISQH